MNRPSLDELRIERQPDRAPSRLGRYLLLLAVAMAVVAALM
jgi:hypothetical protein